MVHQASRAQNRVRRCAESGDAQAMHNDTFDISVGEGGPVKESACRGTGAPKRANLLVAAFRGDIEPNW